MICSERDGRAHQARGLLPEERKTSPTSSTRDNPRKETRLNRHERELQLQLTAKIKATVLSECSAPRPVGVATDHGRGPSVLWGAD